MNKQIKNVLLSVLLCMAMVFTLIPANLTAAGATPSSLSYNSGTRDQIATKLSADAALYYSGSNAYSSFGSLTGSSLKSKLYTLMSSTMTSSVTYKALTTYWPKTDAENGKEGTVLFYADEYGTGFNREHVWPKSSGSFYQIKGGCDLHHLRPSNPTVNSTRGNHTMADLGHKGTPVTYNGKTVGWLDTGADKFEPLDNVKGDVARIYLYMYVRWQQPNLYQNVSSANLPPMDSDDSANDGKAVIESLDTLLKWNKEDPVDTWEMSRNDLTEDVQGNRNVFIDYPELAWKLFGKTVPSDYVYPSKNGGTAPSASPSPSPSVKPTVSPSPSVSPKPTTGSQVYKLVTSVDEIGTGGKFILYGVNGTYKGALNNVCTSGRMGVSSVTVSNNTITNPDSSIIWTLKEQSTKKQYSIYNEASKKYLVINANSTSGFALATSSTYFFNATSASAKAANAIYLSTTATGGRKISIYQKDFRPYATSNYNALYLYKLQ